MDVKADVPPVLAIGAEVFGEGAHLLVCAIGELVEQVGVDVRIALRFCDRGVPEDGLPVVGEVFIHDLGSLVVEVQPHICAVHSSVYVPVEGLRSRRGHVQDLVDPIIVDHLLP